MYSFELCVSARAVSFVCTEHAAVAMGSYKNIFTPSQTGQKKSPFTQNMNKY